MNTDVLKVKTTKSENQKIYGNYKTRKIRNNICFYLMGYKEGSIK